jgi:hypothetical protein
MFFEESLFYLAIAFPWMAFTVNIKFFHGKYKLIFVLSSLVFVYLTLMLQVYLINVRLESELYVFDINGDGVFSGTEINSAQEEAMLAVVSDTGRAMAPITGAIFSVLYSAITFVICFSLSWLWSKFRVKRI